FPPSCALPHLHSFPTRRSSDLSIVSQPFLHRLVALVGVLVGDAVVFAFRRRRPSRHLRCPCRHEGQALVFPALPSQHPLVWVPRDRKSTRLNSSHVSISYAVFC